MAYAAAKSLPFSDRMERQGPAPEGCFLTSTGMVWMHALYMPFPDVSDFNLMDIQSCTDMRMVSRDFSYMYSKPVQAGWATLPHIPSQTRFRLCGHRRGLLRIVRRLLVSVFRYFI